MPTTKTPSQPPPGDTHCRLPDLETPLISSENNKSSSSPEKLCIDEMLQKYSGEFGRWQLRHFVLTSFAWALEALHTMVMIFSDKEPTWRCIDAQGCPPERGLCDLEPGSWEWIGGHGGSTVAEWGLVCGEKYKVGLVQGLFFAGCMIGAGIFGHLSDSFLGRKGSLTVVCILNAIFGCLTSLSPNYFLYATLRLLTGFSTGGVGLCAFVLATEPIGPTKRGVAGMSTFYFFSLGIALLTGIAYIFPSWRSLYLASSLPSIVFVFFVIPFLSESPRWYLVRGMPSHAMRVLNDIAITNSYDIPEGVQLILDDDANATKSKSDTAAQAAIQGSLIDVLRSPITLVRLFLAVAINFSCSVVYYGLSLNVVNLQTNLYLNVLLNAIAEMPAFTLTAILLDKFGRKPLAIGTMWFSGMFCLCGSFLSGSGGGHGGARKVLRMLCGVLGIFGMAGTYNLLFIYTTELFPTVVRNAALGCATQAAQMGAILAPFVVVLGGFLPFAVFAVCGIVGGALGFYLPETLNRPLYDTMAGMEEGEAALEDD